MVLVKEQQQQTFSSKIENDIELREIHGHTRLDPQEQFIHEKG